MFGKKNYKYVTTMRIDGMMCGQCEVHVQENLRKVEGVKSEKASKSKGTAIVKSDEPLSREALEKAVTGIGYDVLDIDSMEM